MNPPERNTFAALFYMRNDKINKKGEAPIYLRITINGEKAEYATGERTTPQIWNEGKIKGNSAPAKRVKDLMDNLRAQVMDIRNDYRRQEKQIIPKQVVAILNGKTIMSSKSVCEVFELHNAMVYNLINIDYAQATYTRYITTLKHIKEYIMTKYGEKDMLLSAMDFDFIRGFEIYMKITRKCNHNTTMKYIKMFKVIIHYAIKNDWIEKNPFINFECPIEKTEREFLSDDELRLLREKEIEIDRLAIIRDIFIFSCYTGLAYSDVAKLTKNNISKGVDGGDWLFVNRTKTNIKSTIPLHSIAKEILENYKEHPISETKKVLLPIPSNQKVNAYLKEVGDICGINKNLTFHMARHKKTYYHLLINGLQAIYTRAGNDLETSLVLRFA